MPVSINGNTGVITGLAVGGLPDGTIDADSLASNAVTSAKLASGVGGKILQVVNTIKTNYFSGQSISNALVDITGLTLSITPSSSSNKILIEFNVCMGANNGCRNGIVLSKSIGGGSYSVVTQADADGNKQRMTTIGSAANQYTPQYQSISILDSPNTTSAITYKIQVWAESNCFFKINSIYTFSDTDAYALGCSSITATEVAQ
tara:strand:- start:65 stop:676 length:612 start_codon:yes stop_codon:yes gene_type:complete